MRIRAIATGVLLAVLVVLVPTASATIIGTLNTDSGIYGVMVSASQIKWTPGPTSGLFTTAGGTTLTYNSGVPLGVGVTGSILDLAAPTTFPVAGFMTYPTIPGLSFDLTQLGPGSSNTACAGLTQGNSCSIAPNSPFILTLTSSGTTVTLDALGTVKDSNGAMSNYLGSFTTQLAAITPGNIQTNFATAGYSISSSYSAQFVVTPMESPVPESSTSMMALAGLGLLLVGRMRLKRKQV
jgi:hypothetical protein